MLFLGFRAPVGWMNLGGDALEGEGHPVLRRTLGDEGKILSRFFGEDGGQEGEKKKVGGNRDGGQRQNGRRPGQIETSAGAVV